ncbi:TPA: hypothetical protein ACH3X2_000306 [Trebouxia sp. C0005]
MEIQWRQGWGPCSKGIFQPRIDSHVSDEHYTPSQPSCQVSQGVFTTIGLGRTIRQGFNSYPGAAHECWCQDYLIKTTLQLLCHYTSLEGHCFLLHPRLLHRAAVASPAQEVR